MVIVHKFPVDVRGYTVLGRNNDFPVIECCPCCGAVNRLHRHGFYERYAIEAGEMYRLPICRLICPDCKKTFSILPDFLLPYFQHTVKFIIEILLAFWLSCMLLCTRQLRRFYEKRAYGKTKDIELFFRECGYREPLPADRKEKAIKLFRMVQDLGKSPFKRRWWDHRETSFMAHSEYHGTRVVAMT